MQPRPISDTARPLLPRVRCFMWGFLSRAGRGVLWWSCCLLERMSVDAVVAELADRGRVAVVEEQRLTGVQVGDLRHLVVGQVEIEDSEVLGHPLGPDRDR